MDYTDLCNIVEKIFILITDIREIIYVKFPQKSINHVISLEFYIKMYIIRRATIFNANPSYFTSDN